MAGLNTRFDLVGFDPRGVGASAPVHCLNGAQRDAADAIDPVLDDPQEKKTYIDAVRSFAPECEQSSGKLLPSSTPPAWRRTWMCSGLPSATQG